MAELEKTTSFGIYFAEFCKGSTVMHFPAWLIIATMPGLDC